MTGSSRKEFECITTGYPLRDYQMWQIKSVVFCFLFFCFVFFLLLFFVVVVVFCFVFLLLLFFVVVLFWVFFSLSSNVLLLINKQLSHNVRNRTFGQMRRYIPSEVSDQTATSLHWAVLDNQVSNVY